MRKFLLVVLCLFVATTARAEDAFRWVAQPGFEDAGAAYRGVVPLKQNGLWGLMGLNGEWVAEPQFDAIGTPGIGVFPAEKNGKWGLVDLGGKTAFDFDYDAIGTPSTYTPMKYQGQWYAFNIDGSWDEAPLPFDTLIGNDGTCMVGTANGAPWLANRGKEAKDQAVDPAAILAKPAEGHVGFTLQDKAGHFECAYGTINGGEPDLDEVRPYSEGFAAARKGEGWGYVGIYDTYFEVGGEYEAAREFTEGLAPVKSGGLWGYIDRTGAFVIPPQFDQAYSFSDGIAGVRVGEKRGFILPDGNLVAAPQFDDFWGQDGGAAPVKVGELWGVIAPDATDPTTRFNMPLASLTAAQKGRDLGYTLQPSNPHYYVFQDIASVHSMTFTADETVMVTNVALQNDGEIALWDMTSHRLIRKFPMPEVTQALLLPDSQIVLAGLSTGYLVLLDAVTGAELFRIHPHKAAVLDMVLSPDATRLATTDGETIRQWDLTSGASLGAIDEPAQKLRYSPDGQSLYAGTKQGNLVNLGLDGKVIARAEPGQGPQDPTPDEIDGFAPTQAIPSMAIGPDGTLVVVNSMSEQQPDGFYSPRYWLDVIQTSGSRKIDLPEGMRDVLSVDLSSDGKMVAYSGSVQDDENAPETVATEVRDMATGALIYSDAPTLAETAEAAGTARYVLSADRLGFTPSGKLMVIGQEGQDILLYDPQQQKQLADFARPLVGAQTGAALPDGNRYFNSDGNGKVWVWDLAQGALETTAVAGDFSFGVEEGAEIDGDKVYYYSGLDDSVMQGFDMATLQPVPMTEEEQATRYSQIDFGASPEPSFDVQSLMLSLGLNSPPIVLGQGRIAVTSEAVGLHHAYDLKTNALLADFLATPDGEWLVLTPEGFFAASPKGAQLVSVSNGLHAFAVDQAYQALYRPDLVQAKLAGDPDGTVAMAAAELDLARIMGSGPAPVTRFSLPRDGAKSADPDIDVQIELQDEGGGIGRVEWRLNGVTVEVQPTREAVALDEDTPKAKARMALDPGENIIEVVAYNAAGLLASAPQRLTVNWDGVASTEPPSLHVLAVGVNDYADGRLQLKYAAADAKAFASAMEKAGAGLFKSVDVVTLLDADVTEAKLDAAFTAMGAQAKSQDVFVFFLAGHGKTIEGKYYFIPQDFRFDGEDPIRAHGINQDRWQEWASRIKAKKSVMIYDTCESGSLTGSRSVDAAMAQSAAVERLTRAMGRTILSASTDDAPALEGYQGHGVMTWAMLDALGQGDTNGNSTIEVTELASFLDVKVPELSSAAFGFRQVPQMSIKGSDFALGAAVTVLGDAPESFPATLTHVVAGGTKVLDGAGGAVLQTVPEGVFYGVFKVEEKDGFARIAKDGKALGWVAVAALTPLQ